ncbi:hypothetical protein GCM10010169_39360 [Micromonospora fulviviridis]|uniref:hypothetical protein n=1 Tax=Micromonospora fulviviridis TaxID=47860 RepID=UPI00166EDE05|nr:hypothetical protein [Micromonospora fulviviridis]GGR91176.1 hypothetical protein GCM10010169_39360 [Micromonospora fulviviridis]
MNHLWSTILAGLLALTAAVPTTVTAPPAAGAPAARATTDRAPAGGAVAGRAPLGGPATVTQVEVLSVRGAGPYRIGARLDRLAAAGLIDWTAPGCAGVVHAGATGAWAGKIMLAFRFGRLVSVGTATVPPRSPAGASVGMSFADLERIYGRRGALIRNDAGDAEAYLVRFGSRAELFTSHPIRSGVGYYEAGIASYVESGFRHPSC